MTTRRHPRSSIAPAPMPPSRRRCIACLQVQVDHLPERLVELGYRPHPYDPGERRRSEPLARDVVWTTEHRRASR